MTVRAPITMPSFSDDELAVLRRVETVLARHPYMRADLGGPGPVARELEGALSTRLALLHTAGSAEVQRETAVLRGKLRAWETQLADAVLDEEGSEHAGLRYATTLLLHPDPQVEDNPSTSPPHILRVTTAWEQVRQNAPAKAVLAEKLRQNRDFFRHGAMLPFYWMRRRRIRALLPRVFLDHSALRDTLFAIEQVGPLVDNFAFKGAGGVPLSTSVAVADIAFFYMQLADEFLDELAAAAGGHDAAGRLVRSLYRDDIFKRPLCDLSLDHIRELGVEPDVHATKFGFTLATLFDCLTQLAATMDGLLLTADRGVVRSTHLFLHHCFQTYLDEADLCASAVGRRADRMRLQDTSIGRTTWS
jgi:hypothetical protein